MEAKLLIWILLSMTCLQQRIYCVRHDLSYFCDCIKNVATRYPLRTNAKECFDNYVFKNDLIVSSEAVEKCEKEGKINDQSCEKERLYQLGHVFIADIESMGTPLPFGQAHQYDPVTSTWDYYRRLFTFHPKIREVCEIEPSVKNIPSLLSNLAYTMPTWLQQASLYTNAVVKAEKFQEETERLCSADTPPADFCRTVDIIKGIAYKYAELIKMIKDSSIENGDVEEFQDAALLNFMPLLIKHPNWGTGDDAIQPHDARKQERLYNKFTKKLLDLTFAKDFDMLEKLLKVLPGPGEIPHCNRVASNPWCFFKRLVDQTTQYLKLLKRNKRGRNTTGKSKKKVLTTDIDYKSLLIENRMQEIIERLQGTQFTLEKVADFLKNEFEKSAGERFNELKNYFTKVETYNQKKVRADVGYAEGMLERFEGEIGALVEALQEDMSELLVEGQIVADLTLANKIVKQVFVMATYANPIKYFQDISFSDAIEVGQEVLTATEQVFKAHGVLPDHIKNLNEKTENCRQKFEKNRHFLKLVKKVMEPTEESIEAGRFEWAKARFLQLYIDYDPQVKAEELTEIGELQGNIVDELCKIIDAPSGTYAHIVAGKVNYDGLCWKMKISIAKMIGTLTQIYEFQFEYIEAVAGYMRARSAVEAAKDINKDYDSVAGKENPNESETLKFLNNLAGISYLAYQVQTLNIIEDYCDNLQYREAGQRPSVCRGASTDLPSLLAHVSMPCDSEVEEFVDLPVQPFTDNDKKSLSSINLLDLMKGKNVLFKIPNFKWLVDNEWLLPNDKHSVFYVKNFQLILPLAHNIPRKVSTEVRVIANNQLVIGGTKYVITPEVTFASKYKEGVGAMSCRGELLTNPFTTCRSHKLPKICIVTKYDTSEDFLTSAKYPSVYSLWQLQVKGYENVEAPKFSTPLKLKGIVRLCKVKRHLVNQEADHADDTGKRRAHGQGKKKNRVEQGGSIWGCCRQETNYFDATANTCQACPDGSKEDLNGYYCKAQDEE